MILSPSTNPIGLRDRPHISPSTGYYRSYENEKRNHHIQFKKNNNLRNKMVERTNHEVLSVVVNELLHPPFVARASLETAPLGSAQVQET
jgi:hypothetical protein